MGVVPMHGLHDLHPRKVINAGGANRADGPFGAVVFHNGKVLLLAPLILLAGALAWVLLMSVLISVLRAGKGGKRTRDCRAQALQHTLSRARAIPVPGRAPSNRRRHALPLRARARLQPLGEAQYTSYGNGLRPPLPRDGESFGSSYLSKEKERGSLHITAFNRECTASSSSNTSPSEDVSASERTNHMVPVPDTQPSSVGRGVDLARSRSQRSQRRPQSRTQEVTLSDAHLRPMQPTPTSHAIAVGISTCSPVLRAGPTQISPAHPR